ncbi:hypothetical protein Tco_0743908 [Tanacetum coccineum]
MAAMEVLDFHLWLVKDDKEGLWCEFSRLETRYEVCKGCLKATAKPQGTKGFLEALELKGDDGGACKLLGRLLGKVIEVLEVVSSGWSFVSGVPGQMTYPVASSTLDSARSYMMQGAPFTQGTVSSIPIGGSISPEGFLLPILLLVMIIVTVLIVAVILVVVVIAFVGVVIVVVFIEIVVVGGVSSIFKFLFVIIGVLRRIVFYYLLHQPLSYGNGFLQSLRF